MQEAPHTISASRQASSTSQVCSASGRAATDIPQLTSAQGGSEDIGRYIDGTKPPERLNRLTNAMDRGTKYQLLTRHFVPSFDYNGFLRPIITAAIAPSAWNTHEISLGSNTALV